MSKGKWTRTYSSIRIQSSLEDPPSQSTSLDSIHPTEVPFMLSATFAFDETSAPSNLERHCENVPSGATWRTFHQVIGLVNKFPWSRPSFHPSPYSLRPVESRTRKYNLPSPISVWWRRTVRVCAFLATDAGTAPTRIRWKNESTARHDYQLTKQNEYTCFSNAMKRCLVMIGNNYIKLN